MKSDIAYPNSSAEKEGETVYNVQTFTDKLSAENVKICIEKIVLKKIFTIDISSE